MADLAADLDLRRVRYFIVVAEHLNFGRAAAALHLAQPSLSRQIRGLEDQLGVRLLNRTPQGSSLTVAGEAFLPQARVLLDAARQAALNARAAAPPHAITIGYIADFIITPAVRDLRRRHPDAEIRTRHLDWTNAHHALADGRVDVLVARSPFPSPVDRLRIQVLYEEPRVLVVASSHPLAGEHSVKLDDFAGESFVPCPVTGMVWRKFSRLEPRDNGQPAPVGTVEAESFEDKLELIAEGEAIAILPATDRHVALRQDLTAVPIEGIDPYQVVVATRAAGHNRLVTDFIDTARAHLVPSQ
jgi:DNA-binding transcriptional LysR family regulator